MEEIKNKVISAILELIDEDIDIGIDTQFSNIKNWDSLLSISLLAYCSEEFGVSEINNAAFAAEDYDAVMVPMPAKSAKEALAFMKAMNMQGMAVTIPHKFSIMPLLDRVSPFARKVGAVNTVVKKGGSYIGHNTDVLGFEEAFLAFAGDLTDKKVALLGDGGAAQAVKVALSRLGVKFDVFHRTQPKRGYDILVNATPVDPIPDYVFTGRELVYDLGYVPEITPLMARSAAVGCKVENGFSMLISQARAQRSEYEKARVNL